ncbi:DUF4387 domain-containing protein [Halalkalibacter krulwichiae]|uniref:DUF4387 domain-containing protein n=1 Tax=Halalkalibacter krulwichiae TaxID=199441 RepID=A0A1X9M992_9BACI|nr:DUF4387 domain-containing protein [Halalkalibacter krulwichiae]ARK29978.1 hypothetical protein BkAM31D_08955 [Halalkalibacter krulwichiae]
MSIPISDVVQIIRSKNAGPFEITFDLIFKSKESFEKVLQLEVFTRERIASLYRIKPEDVLCIASYPPALALKITIARRKPSGGIGETDTFGAQQHAPLLDVTIPAER